MLMILARMQMISDEEMAKKLQEDEHDAEKLRLKQIEEEVSLKGGESEHTN